MAAADVPTNTNFIIIKTSSNFQKIPLADILYIESNDKRAIIHTANETLECMQSIGSIAENLTKSFFRCHRCYIVNLQFVSGYTSSSVQLKRGEDIPLSRRKRALFVNMYAMYDKSGDVV